MASEDEIQVGPTERPAAAAAPARLAADASLPVLEQVTAEADLARVRRTALDWQSISQDATGWEGRGAMRSLGGGRLHELAGCIASAGELLAMAFAASVEVELWNRERAATGTDLGVEMGQRGMAEVLSHYLLATSHLVTNVVGRAVALDLPLRPELVKRVGSDFPPHSRAKSDWLSANQSVVGKLDYVARSSSVRGIPQLCTPLNRLLSHPAWVAVSDGRNRDFHQRRPQSSGLAGVPLSNPWEPLPNGQAKLSYRAWPSYADGDDLAVDSSAAALQALQVLTTTMIDLLAVVQGGVTTVLRGRRPPLAT